MRVIDYLKESGFPIIFGWAAHRAIGSQGGEDRKTPIGYPLRAQATGTAHYQPDRFNTVYIILSDGNSVVYEENRTVVGSFPRHVTQGDIVATAGLRRAGITRAPHQHAIVGGKRVPIGDLAAHYAAVELAATTIQPIMPEATMNQIPFVSIGGAWHWYLPAGWQTTTDKATAQLVKKIIGGKNSIVVTPTEWAKLQVAFPNPKA